MRTLLAIALPLALAVRTQVPAPQAITAPQANPAPQAAPAAPDAPAEEPSDAPALVWSGTLAEGLAEVERLSAAGETERAVAVADALLAPNAFARWRAELEAEGSVVLAPALELAQPLIERLGLAGYAEPLRAEVHFAKGCARLAAEEREAAERDFARARADAGPGELRLVAGYNRGTAALLEGEVWRAQIPELSGAPAAPVPLAPSGAAPFVPPQPGAPGDEQPDPLEVARGHYQRAKAALVERLQADWRDADTRANVELVQRRLEELDEIERQREEQQQEQDQQDQSQDQQDQQDQQEDPQDQEGDPQDPQDQEPDQEQQPPEPDQPPESEGEEPEPEESEPEPEPGEEPETPPEEREAEAEPREVYLTKEEVQRLLERLREHEEEAETVRARLYQQSRRRVERDW